LTAARRFFLAGSYTERWSLQRTGGLSGCRIHVAGLTATLTDVLVRLEARDGSAQVTRLTPSAPAFIVEAAPDPAEVVRSYLALGVEHILTGVDHLLFVLGLLLLVKGWGRIVKTITAFTLAHSVTLSLAALGVVTVPSAPVEAVIALSIVFVAWEVAVNQTIRPLSVPNPSEELLSSRKPSLTQQQPWLVAFTFGLLHGLGFAGALSETGLPKGHIPLALCLFSAGVELGHLAFVAVVLTLGAAAQRLSRKIQPLLPRCSSVRLAPSYAIGGTAMYWLIQRIALL
jgi:hydrogenase/urease accessory protein HupE